MSYDEHLKLQPSNLCPSCGCKPACLPENYYMPEDGVYFECMNDDCEVVYVENKEWIKWESEMRILIEDLEEEDKEEDVYCDVCGLDYTNEDPCPLH